MGLSSTFICSLLFYSLVFLSSGRSQLIKIPKTFSLSVHGFNESHHENLDELGSAMIDTNGAVQVTPAPGSDISFSRRKSGRIMLKTPFKIWEDGHTNSSDIVASFNSTFLVNFFVLDDGRETPAEGFAFVIAPDLKMPENSYGEWLGLTNATLNGNSSNKFVAIELDTKKQAYDLDDNHIGLDINSVQSNRYVSLSEFNISLAPPNIEVKYMVWVEYNGTTKLLEVYMDEGNRTKPTRPVLSEEINLKDYVNQYSHFGFSASTGDTAQLNCLLQWDLTVMILPEDENSLWKVWVGVGIGVFIVVLVISGVVYYMMRNKVVDDVNMLNALKILPGMPREFKFRDLKRATNNFDEKMKLGQGGFGVVYKGVLAKENIEVAVKKFCRESIEGKADFLAELTIINRLRHKHLVRLIGWCHKNRMLLLVYEYMPNGSLDAHLFDGTDKLLNWTLRYNIISGLASALHYLHNEYNEMVVHRDLKSSNILLDSNWHACLGDFGLARAVEAGRSSYAELEGIPGTPGYIAPEAFLAGKATKESDVYGFGAVVLEVVCGRRPSIKISESMVLVDWVWKLYCEGRILEAVDERMKGDFVGEEAERLLLLGLACSHPIASERPTTQKIVQIVSGSAPVPDVPHFKPAFVWPMIIDGTSRYSTETMSITSESSQFSTKQNNMDYISITTSS